MLCKKCGAELPENAEFCYECGTKVRDGNAQKMESNKEVLVIGEKKFYVAIVTVILLLGIIIPTISSNNRTDNEIRKALKEAEEKTKETEIQESVLSEDAILLQGLIEVGEDKDLLPGKYEIQGIEDSHYIYIHVTDKNNDDYEDYINTYKIKRNYVLREGYILDIGYETAFTKLD